MEEKPEDPLFIYKSRIKVFLDAWKDEHIRTLALVELSNLSKPNAIYLPKPSATGACLLYRAGKLANKKITLPDIVLFLRGFNCTTAEVTIRIAYRYFYPEDSEEKEINVEDAKESSGPENPPMPPTPPEPSTIDKTD